jgi:uncharacterized lipoprotein YajG
MTTIIPPSRRACAIVLRNVLVALDLSMTVADARPDLLVVCATDAEDALRQLPGDAHVAIVFAEQLPKDFAATPFGARVAQTGAVLVHVGTEGALAPTQAKVLPLPYPFGRDDVLAILAACT